MTPNFPTGFVDPGHPVPPVIRRLADTDPVTPIWVNGEGGITCRIDGAVTRFAKWAPAGADLDLPAEAERLRWARRHAMVPAVLDAGGDAEGDWIVTSALAGESAISARGRADPEATVRVVGAALRQLHDTLPVVDCPFDWSVGARLERSRCVA